MARNARVKKTFGMFYIQQTSSADRNLFQEDKDRACFLRLLQRAQAKFGFKLFAYCLLSADTYHLVIDTNGSDLSSIMKSINIGYAMYVKSDRPLFRDRYKSELLTSLAEVQEKLRLVHQTGDTIYNSYCHYDLNTPLRLDWIAPLEPSSPGSGPSADCRERLASLPAAAAHLERLAEAAGLSTADLLKDKACRNQLIRDFRTQSTLSLRELGLLFGLCESSICKILNLCSDQTANPDQGG